MYQMMGSATVLLAHTVLKVPVFQFPVLLPCSAVLLIWVLQKATAHQVTFASGSGMLCGTKGQCHGRNLPCRLLLHWFNSLPDAMPIWHLCQWGR